MRNVLCLAAVAFLAVSMASCTSKAKKEREVQEALERMDKEHQAQALKKQSQPQKPSEGASRDRADGIVARVNDDVIFDSDLSAVVEDVFRGAEGRRTMEMNPAKVKQVRRLMLDKLINKKLLEQEAVRRGILVSDDELEAFINRYLSGRGISREQLYVELAAEKKSMEEFKKEIITEAKVFRMLQLEIRSHIHISEKQCRDFYERNKDKYTRPGRVHIQQIVMVTRGLSPQQKEEKRAKMKDLRQRVLAGEDFGDLAREFSEGPNAGKGGDCGFFEEGELLPALDKEAFSSKPGQVSPIIETDVGFHLMKVIERETARGASYERLRDEIRAKLEEEEYQRSLERWLRKLRAKAYIDIRL